MEVQHQGGSPGRECTGKEDRERDCHPVCYQKRSFNFYYACELLAEKKGTQKLLSQQGQLEDKKKMCLNNVVIDKARTGSRNLERVLW